MKNKKERFLYVLWIVITVFVFGLMGFLGHFSTFQNFFKRIEQATFDVRQNIISSHKKSSDNIVIIEIDDASYEYIMDKYAWPLPRKIWADVADNIESIKPKYIIFDLLFLKSNLNDIEGNIALAKEAKKYDNIYFAMNFDNYSETIRKSPEFKDELKIKIKDTSIINNKFYLFSNARGVMKELAEATNNIGSITIIRDEDGIIRNEIPLYGYKNELYPNLSLRVAMNILNKDEIEIKDNYIIIDDNHKIPIDKMGRTILNWYGKSKTFAHIPFWRVIEAIKNNDKNYIKNNFKDKIIYIGTTATGLSDVKSVPVDYNFAGVEIHATFLNNILDNDFIKKAPLHVDLIISIILCAIVGFAVLRTQTILKTFIILILTLALYLIISTIAMEKFNIWYSNTIPIVTIILSFISVYLTKYFLITKDYEQTYKLAITDGLTQLYNHRYFQEQMLLATNNYHRYGNKFSVILIDIDFFKKFNDTYGHQSGDCVLRQVANILKKNSRTTDIVCRYGGEEMAVILLNTSKDEAVLTANKICNAVRENKFILTNSVEVNVTISVGVATIGYDANKAQELIEYADKCLYKAKEQGRNQVQHSIN